MRQPRQKRDKCDRKMCFIISTGKEKMLLLKALSTLGPALPVASSSAIASWESVKAAKYTHKYTHFKFFYKNLWGILGWWAKGLCLKGDCASILAGWGWVGPLRNWYKVHPANHLERGETGTAAHHIVVGHLHKWEEVRPILLLIVDKALPILLHQGICPFDHPVCAGVECCAEACLTFPQTPLRLSIHSTYLFK